MMRTLKYLCAVAATATLASQSAANASKALKGETCTFQTKQAIFGGGPPEVLSITWNLSSGKVTGFSWDHGSEVWYAFAANPGTMQAEPSGYYYLFDVGATTAGYDATRYSFKGYIAINQNWPDATLAAVYEGTGTAWLGANGTVICK
jgi:hypothetical protein